MSLFNRTKKEEERIISSVENQNGNPFDILEDKEQEKKEFLSSLQEQILIKYYDFFQNIEFELTSLNKGFKKEIGGNRVPMKHFHMYYSGFNEKKELYEVNIMFDTSYEVSRYGFNNDYCGFTLYLDFFLALDYAYFKPNVYISCDEKKFNWEVFGETWIDGRQKFNSYSLKNVGLLPAINHSLKHDGKFKKTMEYIRENYRQK